MALIIPKNNADAQTLDATLKIYYDANDWVQNADLINRLSAALDDLGIEDEKKEPQSYTKKTQVLAYFGFITWQDVTNSQSARRITDLGKKFYEARLTGDTDKVIEVLIESLSTCTFGRNVIGCDSDSDIEAPNVFIKASLLLGGLNNNEFAFILGLMELSGVDFSDTIFHIKVNRLRGIKTYPTEGAKKWNDPKPITALKNWGFFNSDDNTISDRVLLNYSDALINLRIKNTEKIRFVSEQEDEEDNSKEVPLQQIFYGAPGTGKSNTIKREVDDKGILNYRTTFHPDSDYSTFVGCYKPKMKRSTITKDGVTTTEEKIVYSFEPQAFINAYVQAWKAKDDVYLIIEEINRGNCAQIFGDLFQLLDRKNGESEYPVDADSSLADYLQTALAESKREDIPAEVKNGTKLKLPSNLYIWATMNTSDQSLFPIDSAFKRRWEWKYMKIKNEGKEWKIDVKIKNANGEEKLVDWWDFIRKVNDIIASMTSSADKQLGYFFCKADKKTPEKASEPNSENDLISLDTFVSKVLFYLWNDVFKDYGFEDVSLFQYISKTEEGKEMKKDLTFPDFYKEDSNDVNPQMVTDFVQKVMNWKKKEEAQN